MLHHTTTINIKAGDQDILDMVFGAICGILAADLARTVKTILWEVLLLGWWPLELKLLLLLLLLLWTI